MRKHLKVRASRTKQNIKKLQTWNLKTMPDNDEELEATEDNITLEDSKHSISKYEASVDCGGSNESNMTELTTEESFQADKPKILIQRVFYQPEKNVVEQKIDYVIADSEVEITKHVFGGLFRTKYYKYAPHDYCKKHDPDLFEHTDETLVKLGDKFDSLESFRLYVDGNAKHWKYYLKCSDSHRKDGKDIFVFQCVLARKRTKFSLAKGVRKRTSAVPRSDCPCRVILKPVPFGAKDLTVIYVCNHHDHPLTDEYFNKLQHGRRIHPNIKAELMDLVALDVDREVVQKYYESLTGLQMSYGSYHNLLLKMKKNKIERQFSLEKLKEMSQKIERIKEELGITSRNDEEYVDNDLISRDYSKKDKASQVAEAFSVLKAVSAPMRTPRARRRRNNQQYEPTPVTKQPRKQKSKDLHLPYPQSNNNKSRLETRLQELKHDQETLQSIKHLQDSVRCETKRNPWIMDQVEEPMTRFPEEIKKKPHKNSHKIIPEPQSGTDLQAVSHSTTVDTENTQYEDNYVDNQDITYENEITVIESTEEYCPESIVSSAKTVENDTIDLDNSNVHYCIQYDDGEQVNLEGEQYILVLDDVESFENLPEVQIQATEFATISIVSENNQNQTKETGVVEQETDKNIPDVNNLNMNNENQFDNSGATFQLAEEIHVIDQSNFEATPDIDESTVYEVIQTNDTKILPSKEIVNTEILNNPIKSHARPFYNGKLSKHPKYYKSNNTSIKHMTNKRERKQNRLHRHIPQKNKGGSRKIDVVSQPRELHEYIKEEFKEYLDYLDDGECYMVVVNDEESAHADAADDDGTKSYEATNNCAKKKCNSNEALYFEYAESTNSDSGSHLDSVKSEAVKNELANYDYGRITRKVDFRDSLKNEVEQLDPSCVPSRKRPRSERELLNLEMDVARLKRQKRMLEQDVQKLVAAKDYLIDDITKTASTKRLFK